MSTAPSSDFLRQVIVNQQPMTAPFGAINFFRPRYGSLEPSAIERLGGIVDPEIAGRVATYDTVEAARERQREEARAKLRAALERYKRDFGDPAADAR